MPPDTEPARGEGQAMAERMDKDRRDGVARGIQILLLLAALSVAAFIVALNHNDRIDVIEKRLAALGEGGR